MAEKRNLHHVRQEADNGYMIQKMQRRLPTLADMLRDLSATPEQIAKALHVNQSTVYRWITADKAPRPAMLALYWMTRWGQSEIDAELWNRASVYEGLAKALELELYKLQSSMVHLGQIGDFGSANDPHRLANAIHPPSPCLEPGQPAQVAPVASLCVTPRAIGLT